MKKLSYFVAFILVATMLLSCSKEEPFLPLKLIQSETFSNGDHATYEYDSAGKLYKKTENVGSAMGVLNTYDITSTYTYSHDTIKVTKVSLGFDGTSQTTSTSYEIHVLNSQGYISKSINLNKDLAYTNVITYEYNLNGNLTKEVQDMGSIIYTAYYNYLGDNMISSVINANTIDYNASFSYYTSKQNSLNHESYGINFLGKESKNLMRNANMEVSGNQFINFDYEYEFDQDGYVSKKTTIAKGYTEWVKYTYK